MLCTKNKVQIVNELRQQFPLNKLLDIASIARSTFYYQCKTLLVPDKYTDVKQVVQNIFYEHKDRYGYRRVTSVIRSSGLVINHKTIQRLMQKLGIKSCIRGVNKYRSYKSGLVSYVAPNILQRDFNAQAPNQKWVTDVTEFNVSGEKLYLSPILDLYNSEIVSYRLAKRPFFGMVQNMLFDAFKWLKNTEKPIIHSDQGWQYRMPSYQKIRSKYGITQSMSRRGNCLDHAVMENFFGILKSECFYTQKFQSIEQLAAELKEYIHYYNHDRIKLKLKGLSPVQYRIQSQLE